MSTRHLVLALVACAALRAPALGAQTLVQAGRGSVSQAVRVGLVIPPRLRVRVAQQQRLGSRGDTTTFAMDVEVAANLAWTLSVAAGTADVPQQLRVKDSDGNWRALDQGTATVPVAADQSPSDWRTVRIEVQVVGARGPRALPALTLDLHPASR